MTGRIDGSQTPRIPTKRLGTTPLGEIPLPSTPGMPGDSNRIRGRGTQPLPPSSTLPLIKEVAAKVPEKTEAVEAPTPWWKKIINKAEDVVDTAKDVAKSSKKILEAGVDEVRASISQGEGISKALHDGVHAAESKLVEVADARMDSVLGDDGVYTDKGAHALDLLYANIASRLEIGESVAIQLDAGCSIPLEEFGIPNANLDGSGTVTLKRVQKTDAEGKPLVDQDGKPVTELEATLELSGKAGASYSTSVGFNATAKAGSHRIGARASAEAEAGGGIQGRVAFTFSFNPDSGTEMGGLNHLLTGTPRPSELRKQLTSLDGEGGLYADATASASLEAGIFSKEVKNGRYTSDEADTETGLLSNFNKLSVAGIESSLGLGASVGQSHNFRTGEHTLYIKANGALQGSANAGLLGTDKAGIRNATLAITLDKSGKITGAALESELTVEEFKGIRSTVENASGRKIDDGILAQLGESDSVKVTYALEKDKLDQITSKGAGAAKEALKIIQDTKNLAVTAQSTHTDTAEIGFDLEAMFGAEIGIRANLKASHGQETGILQE